MVPCPLTPPKESPAKGSALLLALLVIVDEDVAVEYVVSESKRFPGNDDDFGVWTDPDPDPVLDFKGLLTLITFFFVAAEVCSPVFDFDFAVFIGAPNISKGFEFPDLVSSLPPEDDQVEGNAAVGGVDFEDIIILKMAI